MIKSSGARKVALGVRAMQAFIALVIIAGLFGPYVISIILGSVCVATWLYSRTTNDANRIA